MRLLSDLLDGLFDTGHDPLLGFSEELTSATLRQDSHPGLWVHGVELLLKNAIALHLERIVLLTELLELSLVS